MLGNVVLTRGFGSLTSHVGTGLPEKDLRGTPGIGSLFSSG